jgi:hypothetical protein
MRQGPTSIGNGIRDIWFLQVRNQISLIPFPILVGPPGLFLKTIPFSIEGRSFSTNMTMFRMVGLTFYTTI